ncbi:hypothetical protein GCM10010985_40340 [Caballeronia grimmiae]|uniref:Uncharacterized protein n=1 Tax=Caballeronia grimmiae TaxID=1071679 RepID=A0ABQ1RWY0_9BURK|nr:hypothetical protein GCM10010985_40340 [Caballeronia grimmiae]
MTLRQARHQPACDEVLQRDEIAVHEQHRGAFAFIDVMKADAVDVDELTDGRMLPFGASSTPRGPRRNADGCGRDAGEK